MGTRALNGASAQTDHSSSHVRGMVTMVLAVLALPLIDAIGKWLAMMDNVPPATIAFLRFAVQVVLMFAILFATGGLGKFRTPHPFGNLVRGALIGFASLCFFMAVKYMPLADAMAVFFAEPLILILMSAAFLKEKIGWRRYSAVTVGLIGTLIVIQPSYEIFGPVSLLPLLSALCFATYLTLNRKYGSHESPLVMQFYAGIGGGLITALIIILASGSGLDNLQFSLPQTAFPWLLLLLLGTIGTFGHLMVVQAFKLAPASMLAPFQYLEIVTAVIVGLILFEDFPTPSKWLGIAIIVGSGIYVFVRERKVKAHISA